MVKGERAIRRSFFIYPTQLRILEEIAVQRRKKMRQVVFEAWQNYIKEFLKGRV
jgi:hypothetical protein